MPLHLGGGATTGAIFAATAGVNQILDFGGVGGAEGAFMPVTAEET